MLQRADIHYFQELQTEPAVHPNSSLSTACRASLLALTSQPVSRVGETVYKHRKDVIKCRLAEIDFANTGCFPCASSVIL